MEESEGSAKQNTNQDVQQPTPQSEGKEKLEPVVQKQQTVNPKVQTAPKTAPIPPKEMRTYVCDKCKWCDEFIPSSDRTICNTCGCALIAHIKDAEEDEDSDPQEWVDEDDEDED